MGSLRIFGCLLLSVVLSGCFIQSFHPFYTEGSLIDLPEITGAWQLVSQGSENLADQYREPWQFEKNRIWTFEKGVSSRLDVKYFRVEGTLFADLVMAEPEEGSGPNKWWLLHTVPVHSVCKVQLSGDTVSFNPLNGDWLIGQIKKKKIILSSMQLDEKGEHTVLTASSKELSDFLKKYRDDAGAFPKDNAYTFRRPAAEGKDLKRP
ncbi:MAG: hypothetical protein EPN25_14940 [Nitrospirae bacterium]|nr:MAG: hypothetical protein EPN25_14940 [Nitrospirota bacterium]